MSASTNKTSFFRHSGWMVISTFLGGIFMVLVQTAASKMEFAEYTAFNALLGVLIVFGGVPSAALQTLFAQQSAAAIGSDSKEHLIATTRSLLKSTFVFWLILAVFALALGKPLCGLLKVKSSVTLALAALVLLPTLWLPVFRGLLQGLHRFAGLGWLSILDGVVRLSAVILIVVLLKGQAAGAMVAVFSGQFVVLLIGAWLTRDIWTQTTPASFSWKPWLRRAVPLTFGLGTVIFMSSLDRVFVQSIFSEPLGMNNKQFYFGALLTGFAIVQFIAPVTAVMFPHIVRSMAKAEKSDALVLTVAVTAGFACLAALGCTLFPKLPLQIIFFSRPEMVDAAPLVPWFGWALLPLTLANVLIQNLLARERFEGTLWFVFVALLYAGTLLLLSPTLIELAQRDPFAAFKRVVQTLGAFNLILFAVAAWLTWHRPNVSGPVLPEHSASCKATAQPEQKTA